MTFQNKGYRRTKRSGLAFRKIERKMGVAIEGDNSLYLVGLASQ